MTYIPVKKWRKIYGALKTIRGLHLRNEKRLKLFFEGLLFVSKTGCPWRYVPWTYGRWRGIHMKFKDWCKRGIWRQLFEALKGDVDGEAFMIDATIVRAHACAAGQAKGSADEEALGRSCGGFSTKVHAMVDALGNPVAFSLTPGQHHDTHGTPLTKGLKETTLLADKGYDSDAFLEKLKKQGVQAVIPPKKTAK